ncbi:hypothetical protein RhiirA1_454550 [Rhizophagus irregularis]|uniref:Serine-threonine/tyrosine-protein kinase catalytic domain-containing protein n=1 Tax=Rhizophagus irregularis TaxID=588596 RepID=A0A2N0S4Y0_9GLOM|nr:hypothetical protein RhiirA1_454550 [Rhizophagus irregularis]
MNMRMRLQRTLVINGIRPKIVSGTPLEYKNLMEECWNADPLKRPDIYTLWKRMEKINLDYQKMADKFFQSEIDNLQMNKVKGNYASSRLFTSKIYNFENLSEPRNATEEEQEAFHNKSSDFSIPDNNDDEKYNNPNLHSNEQDELEIVYGKFLITHSHISYADSHRILSKIPRVLP